MKIRIAYNARNCPTTTLGPLLTMARGSGYDYGDPTDRELVRRILTDEGRCAVYVAKERAIAGRRGERWLNLLLFPDVLDAIDQEQVRGLEVNYDFRVWGFGAWLRRRPNGQIDNRWITVVYDVATALYTGRRFPGK